MKKSILIVLSLCFFIATFGQSASLSYSISYKHYHGLYLKGDEANVVDLDLEWPEYLNFSSEPILQRYLNQIVFDNNDTSYQESCRKYLSGLGNLVNGQLQSVPDDSKFCYIDVKLHVIGYSFGRYISYCLSKNVAPQDSSKMKKQKLLCYFTYDMINDKILTGRDLLDQFKINNSENVRNELAMAILVNSESSICDNGIESMIYDAVLSKYGTVFYYTLNSQDAGVYSSRSTIPFKDKLNILSKSAKKLVDCDIPKISVHAIPQNTFDGDTSMIYTEVDVLPEPNLSQSLDSYLKEELNLPISFIKYADKFKCGFSFVVERDGSLSNMRSIIPCDPEVERAIIDKFMLMPKWKPAKINGKTVRCFCIFPISVRLK